MLLLQGLPLEQDSSSPAVQARFWAELLAFVKHLLEKHLVWLPGAFAYVTSLNLHRNLLEGIKN